MRGTVEVHTHLYKCSLFVLTYRPALRWAMSITAAYWALDYTVHPICQDCGHDAALDLDGLIAHGLGDGNLNDPIHMPDMRRTALWAAGGGRGWRPGKG
jgi:hypothetical protein